MDFQTVKLTAEIANCKLLKKIINVLFAFSFIFYLKYIYIYIARKYIRIFVQHCYAFLNFVPYNHVYHLNKLYNI